jgi:tRNA dimethylallyltransferase
VEPLTLPAQAGRDYPLVVIVGPTAAGKSALALALAERLGGEIVNYDSVQIYRGFDVGAGKVPAAERRGIPHHLLDYLEPTQLFTAGDYRREALRVLTDLRARAKLPLFVGGAGLYLRALLLGLFEGPARSEALRERLHALAQRRGREHLHRLLERLDRAAAERIRPRDTQKIIRALEVCLLARKPLSTLHARGRRGLEGYRIYKIGLSPQRSRLYERINRRVEAMFAGRLMDEVRALLARPDAYRIRPLEALGYRQACAALRGEMSLEEAIRHTQRATRHYAKRQLTWLRPESDIVWFEGFGDEPETLRRVLSALQQMGLPARGNRLAPHRRGAVL